MIKVFFIIVSFIAALSIHAQTIRIATYNTRNYMITDRFVDTTFRKDYPKPESEKTALRNIISNVQPDVLALQEMGEESFLIELQQDLKAEGTHYPYRAWLDKGDTRHLGLLSKIPFVKVFQEKNIFLKRGILGALFKTNGVQWNLLTVHLKSHHTTNNKDPEGKKQRVAEAHAIKKWLKSKFDMEEALVILAGDFNDRPRSRVIKSLTKDDFLFKLSATDSRNEVWTFSHPKDGFYDQIDYIFISPKFLQYIPTKKAAIADGPASHTASDHRMVYVDLVF